MNTAEFPRATIIREGIDTGKVFVEFGPKGPYYLLDEQGTATLRMSPYARTSARAFRRPEGRKRGPLVASPRLVTLRANGLGMLAQIDDQPMKMLGVGDTLTIPGAEILVTP